MGCVLLVVESAAVQNVSGLKAYHVIIQPMQINSTFNKSKTSKVSLRVRIVIFCTQACISAHPRVCINRSLFLNPDQLPSPPELQVSPVSPVDVLLTVVVAGVVHKHIVHSIDEGVEVSNLGRKQC